MNKYAVERTRVNNQMDPRSFLILDDCLYDQSWVKNKDVRALFYEWQTLQDYVYYNYAVCSRYTS